MAKENVWCYQNFIEVFETRKRKQVNQLNLTTTDSCSHYQFGYMYHTERVKTARRQVTDVIVATAHSVQLLDKCTIRMRLAASSWSIVALLSSQLLPAANWVKRKSCCQLQTAEFGYTNRILQISGLALQVAREVPCQYCSRHSVLKRCSLRWRRAYSLLVSI
jgi:hypothetical protein